MVRTDDLLGRPAVQERSARTTRRATHRELVQRLRGAGKSNRGAAAYSRWVNRPLGRHLAAVAHRSGLGPNAVSVLSATFTYVAITLIAVLRPTWGTSIAVTALLVVGYALDSADGQVARLAGTGSVAGEWLDHVLDAVKIATFHLAVAISWFRFFRPDQHAVLLVPLAFAATSSVFFFALILTDLLRRVERVRTGGTAVTTASVDPHEPAPVLRSLVVLPNDYGLLCLVMVLMPLGRTFAITYSVLAAASALFLVAGLYRWRRELRALSGPAPAERR